ncbi:MAG TPA: FHA domain-containing protein [Ktedonobacteraceae bacterium]|jgi:pSer/pThr/pTyr-binding forkhead associated (FHA) protein|nr:FHA domain-containing protein [Ktedonobacteraceae bacterium]
MFAIAINALYTTARRRGTTRQLAGAIVACVFSALLLIPAIVWFNTRFGTEQGSLTLTEISAALVYTTVWGWLVPLSATIAYCLFALPRDSYTAVHIPRQQKRTTRANTTAGAVVPPERQPGVPVPFVYGEGTPWGWLEHRAGRFQGQKLSLTRAIVSIGREVDNDIWLDDETASRYHAELAWSEGQAYLTDNNSLNGVLLNGRRIRGTLIVKSGDLLEIGSYRFLFELAEPPGTPVEQDDPLLYHIPRSSFDLENNFEEQRETPRGPGGALEPLKGAGEFAPPTKPLEQEVRREMGQESFEALQETLALEPAAGSLDQPQVGSQDSLLVICNGELEGKSFLLDRPVITIGRGSESDIIIRDASISRRHAQFLQQANGDYVQDLASRNGTKVNGELLHAPHKLEKGDRICLGTICLEYTFVPEARTTPLPPLPAPPLSRPASGPTPLRLPSKPK